MSDSTGTQQPAFEAKNLNKIFVAEKPVHALVDINLTIPEGSSTCIVGTSGCGKSTLLRILGGFVEETSGTVTRSLASQSVPSSAVVFQEHGIFPWMNVIDNVAFSQKMTGIDKKTRRASAMEWIRALA